MRVLVTGGGGFLGSTLVARLAGAHHVASLDHGRHYAELRTRLGGGIRWVKGDAHDRSTVAEAIADADVLVHLAGVAGERRCSAHPLRSMLSNVDATRVLLDEAARASVRCVVFASSYHVYSTFGGRSGPIGEESPLDADTLYGAQKVLCERMVRDGGRPYLILRIAALYGFGTGVGSQREGAVGRWAMAGLEGRPLEVFGTGEQRIDLVHVDDVVAAIVGLLERPETWNQVFNVGGGEPVRVIDAARMVADAVRDELGRTVAVERKPAPPGRVWPDKWLSIDKLQRALAGYPFTPIRDGIARTVREFARARATR